jgi:hypothetical protein
MKEREGAVLAVVCDGIARGPAGGQDGLRRGGGRGGGMAKLVANGARCAMVIRIG